MYTAVMKKEPQGIRITSYSGPTRLQVVAEHDGCSYASLHKALPGLQVEDSGPADPSLQADKGYMGLGLDVAFLAAHRTIH